MKLVKNVKLEMNQEEAELLVSALQVVIKILSSHESENKSSKEILRRFTILKARILSEME